MRHVVVEGSAAVLADALAEARESDSRVLEGWEHPREGEIRTGVVANAEDAARALLAAVAGTELVVDARADRDVTDRLVDDLRRLGDVDHRTADYPLRPRLTREERALVDLLADGLTLGEAARQLNISRRTADRRLAAVRDAYGVRTTAEAVVKARTR